MMLAAFSPEQRWNVVRAGLIALVLAAGALIWWLPPLLALALLLAGLVVTLALRYPVAGLALLAFSVPWGSALPVQFGSLPLSPTDVLAALLGTAWVVQAVDTRQSLLSDRVLAPYLILFVLAICVSATQASDVAASAREIIKWIEFGVVYFAAVRFLQTSRQLRLVVAALVAAGVSEALLGFVQFILQSGPAAFGLHRAFFRTYGTFDQPNPYAGYLNMVIPLAVVLAVRGERRPERLAYGAGAAFMLAALLLSQSRGALLACLAALAIVTACLFQRARVVVGIGAFAVTALSCAASWGLVPAGPVTRILTAFGLGGVAFGHVNDANFSAVERAAHWLAGVRMFSAHPLLGVGIGNYSAAYPLYHPRGWYASLEHAHNYYINIAAEAGVLGLAAYVLLVGSALWYSYAIARRARGSVSYAVALGALGALVATSIHNLFDVLYVHGMATLLAVLLALPAAGRTIDSTGQPYAGWGDGAGHRGWQRRIKT